MIIYPEDLEDVKKHTQAMRAALVSAGVPSKTTASIRTKALLTGRKVTGEWATNRDRKWTLVSDHPQFGTEINCKIIFVKLAAQIFCFDNAPKLPTEIQSICEERYLGHEIASNSFVDSLLHERFDFNELVTEGQNPVHGHSNFHIGHEDPTIEPKHQPENVAWRTYRSNLIQGNMTLKQAVEYLIRGAEAHRKTRKKLEIK